MKVDRNAARVNPGPHGIRSCAPPPVQHGGADASGIPRFDFSTNGNAAGPLPSVARAVARADRTRYPDPRYHALCERLAAWHGIDPARVVVSGSASEFIHRFTRVATDCAGVRRALLPTPGYGDYAVAAAVAKIEAVAVPSGVVEAGTSPSCAEAELRGSGCPSAPRAGDLCWWTEPANPTGGTRGVELGPAISRATDAGAIVVLDLAYQPLRFDGLRLAPEADRAWQIWSPNKACGLTGVRAAYAITPPDEASLALAHTLRRRAASWVAGAGGVAMLAAFAAPTAQEELALRLPRLRAWRDTLAAALRGVGWHVADAASVTPFFVAQAPGGVDTEALRARGIKLRATDSMGLAGWMRLSAQPPAALAALREALPRARGLRSADRAR